MRSSSFVALVPLLLCSCSCAPECLQDAQPCHEPVTVTVVNVVDGDTIDVDPPVALPEVGDITRFRFLCVDTPESTTDIECFGPETSDHVRELLEGEEVELQFDKDCVGDYGRGLAYVLHDGVILNVELAELGYALPAAERYLDYACCADVLEAVDRAYANEAGGWAQCMWDPPSD